MGPLVPDFLNSQLNLVLAFLLGIAFGFVLEQAGFSSSKKLTGLFYGTDFTVLRVFFTAGVTGMTGVLILSRLGLLDTEMIFVNPTFLPSAIVGGLIMGIGFVVGGYCPGTSFCGAAVGRIDAMAFIAGGFLGVFTFGEAFPLVRDFYAAGSMGDLLVYNVLGLTAGQFGGLLILAAVGIFVLTSWIEGRVAPDGPAARFPVWSHRIAGIALVAVGIFLVPMADRRSQVQAKAADPSYRASHPVRMVSPDELAYALIDHNPRLQLVDVRDAESYVKASLPEAVNVSTRALLNKEARTVFRSPHTWKVFFGATGEDSVRAAATAQLAGIENVAALEGGLDAFRAAILEPGETPGDLGVFRAQASAEIARMIKERSAPKVVRAVKRVQGGCGG
ncbi:MAG: YeeE/YedE thiosulfate transporter family protein [Bryobacteraceae bacterium]